MLEEWDKIIENAKPGAKAAADAMARYMTWYISEVKLRQTVHPPGAYNIQKGGEPPAYGSGTLARTMYMRSALAEDTRYRSYREPCPLQQDFGMGLCCRGQ